MKTKFFGPRKKCKNKICRFQKEGYQTESQIIKFVCCDFSKRSIDGNKKSAKLDAKKRENKNNSLKSGVNIIT